MIRISSEKRGGVWFSLALNKKRKLLACAFSDRSRRNAEKSVREALPPRAMKITNSRVGSSARFHDVYRAFNGKNRNVRLSALDLSHVSDFRKRVYLQLRRIPRGHVTTYGAVAKRLGGRRYARAVGTAVATNPLSLVIPCHRVVPASLKVGNYGMPGRKPSQGGYMKRRLLELEGVKFLGVKISKESLWTPR